MVDSAQGHRTQCLRLFQSPLHPMGINPVSLPSSANSTQQDLYLAPLTTLPCHTQPEAMTVLPFFPNRNRKLFAHNCWQILLIPVTTITALTIETLYGEQEKETKPQMLFLFPDSGVTKVELCCSGALVPSLSFEERTRNLLWPACPWFCG